MRRSIKVIVSINNRMDKREKSKDSLFINHLFKKLSFDELVLKCSQWMKRESM